MPIERDGYASRIRAWQEACGGLPISQQFSKLQEEAREAIEPTLFLSADQLDQLPQTDPELAENLARECVDLSIVAIGIVGLLGHDFSDLFHETVDKIHHKYPPERIRELRALGLTAQAVLTHLKNEWNGNGNGYKAPEPEDGDEWVTLLLTNAGAHY